MSGLCSSSNKKSVQTSATDKRDVAVKSEFFVTQASENLQLPCNNGISENKKNYRNENEPKYPLFSRDFKTFQNKDSGTEAFCPPSLDLCPDSNMKLAVDVSPFNQPVTMAYASAPDALNVSLNCTQPLLNTKRQSLRKSSVARKHVIRPKNFNDD